LKNTYGITGTKGSDQLFIKSHTTHFGYHPTPRRMRMNL
jgi:hypothetical protein